MLTVSDVCPLMSGRRMETIFREQDNLVIELSEVLFFPLLGLR